MKKFILPIAMITGVVLFNLSCSKKGSSAPPCKLITLTEVDGSTTNTTNITYNSEGKIATLVQIPGGGGSTTTSVFTYAGNVILKTTTSSGGGSTTTDSIALNSAGYMIADMQRISGSSGYNYSTYTYDGSNHLLKAVSQPSGGSPSTSVVTYSGGDIQYIINNGGSDTTYLYYNTNKASGPGDYLHLEALAQYGSVLLFNSAHQVSAIKSSGSSITNFDYSYDSKGNITGLVITSGSDIENYSLQYDCGN